MAPRFQTNPAPVTESAREAVKSFYCELCQKGYARMNEFDAHESSYDHQHKKRLKEMKQMQRDPQAAEKARKAERKADEKSGLISFKPVKIEFGKGAEEKKLGGGFKKGGFKRAFGGDEDGREAGEKVVLIDQKQDDEPKKEKEEQQLVEGVPPMLRLEDLDLEGELYDPMCPTGCSRDCPGLHILPPLVNILDDLQGL